MGNDSNVKIVYDYSVEQMVNKIANVILGVGIICAVISALTVVYVSDYAGGKIIDPIGIVIVVSEILSSVVLWAILKVLANISISLKSLNQKMSNK